MDTLKFGNLHKAFELFDEMKGKNIFPDEITYNGLLKGLCIEGKMQEAHERRGGWYLI